MPPGTKCGIIRGSLDLTSIIKIAQTKAGLQVEPGLIQRYDSTGLQDKPTDIYLFTILFLLHYLCEVMEFAL